jgi:hypothetical protein
MAKQFPALQDDHARLIGEQHLFFVATAAPTGRVNLSPKGMDCLRVLGPNRVAWLNVTGSGNETAAHLRLHPRITLMWCSFTKRPVILRVYGTARTIHPRDDDWHAMFDLFEPLPGARQIYDVEIDLVQTSCGYAVPFFDHAGPRDTLRTWTEQRGEEGIAAYWAERNIHTIDGFETGILGDE